MVAAGEVTMDRYTVLGVVAAMAAVCIVAMVVVTMVNTGIGLGGTEGDNSGIEADSGCTSLIQLHRSLGD
jgi:hypothetical protein